MMRSAPRVLVTGQLCPTIKTGASPAPEALDQLVQPRGGLKAKFCVKECPVPRELAYSLRLVALGQVHLDEGSMGAFSERLCPYGRTRSNGGLTPAASSGKAAGQRFQAMQAELPPVFG